MLIEAMRCNGRAGLPGLFRMRGLSHLVPMIVRLTGEQVQTLAEDRRGAVQDCHRQTRGR